MLLSSRDRRINGTLADILGHATKYGFHITHIDCSAKVLLKKAETIMWQIEVNSLPFGISYAFINPGGDFCC